MIKAILLDLDDTLLETNMDNFLPKYFAALGEKMRRYAHPGELTNLIMESTCEMMQNKDARLSNKAVFESSFFDRLGFSKSEVQPHIDEFYEKDFPKLRKYTRPISAAPELVEKLIIDFNDVVIATNPLFPRRAIEHRIEWAGLSQFSFSLITAYENAHFCKPDPLYYSEILEKINCPAHEAIMIGNDLNNDIKPAKSIGMHTYHIRQNGRDAMAGALTDCLSWIEGGGLKKLG